MAKSSNRKLPITVKIPANVKASLKRQARRKKSTLSLLVADILERHVTKEANA